MKQNIIFLGSGSYTIPIIEKLIPHGLGHVITTEKSGPITDFCKKNNIDIISTHTARDLKAISSRLSNCSLGVLASYGVLIPDEIIDIFPNGMINVHPSLLPKWKGPSPIQYTLLNEDKITGVTVIKMDNEFDHGPILSQKKYKLKGDETTQILLEELFSLGATMVEEIVKKLEKGESVAEIPQDHSKETWSEELTRESGKLDINNLEAKNYNLSAMIRAYHPWPGVWLTANLKKQTKKIKLLPNEKIHVEGKNPMNYKDFINGYDNEGKELLEKLNLH